MAVADVIRPSELDAAEVAAWLRLQSAEPQFGNPILGPHFAQAVGEVRKDARVAVYRRAGEPVGFLAHHRRAGGFVRPIGAPFSDYQAFVAASGLGLDACQALRMAGLDGLRLSHLVDPADRFGRFVTTRQWAHRIVVDGASADYLDRLWRSSGNRRNNYRRYRRSLERAAGPIRVVGDDRDRASFEQLIAWKRRQLQRTGGYDFLAVPWARALMLRLFETRSGDFQGQMISLYAGERLAAAHFGVRQADWYHPWIAGFDPLLKEHSPGMVHQVEAIRAMTGLGLRIYDLGPGEDHWKQRFARDGVWIGAGVAAAPTWAGALARSAERLWDVPPLRNAPLIVRARNRYGQIAALEPTFAGRLRAAASTIPARGRRDWAT